MPEYKFSVYNTNIWLQIKELLAISPRKNNFPHLIFILELGTLAFLNCINTNVGVVPLQSCYYFII